MTVKTLKELLDHCEAQGWIMKCFYDAPGEPDYIGLEAAKAQEALEACDEMYLHVYDGAGLMGWVFVVNDADCHPDEQINDYAGDRIAEILRFEEAA
ncbi:hypothetical protein [Rhizobium phage RHph_X66]|nr:hypothetical protein [Rhizobium phage RHph_X66]